MAAYDKDVFAWVMGLKLKRAQEHIEQFKRESEAFLNEDPQRTLVGGDLQAMEAFKASKRKTPVPPRLSIVAGDAIHQIRSCLDHVVCALIWKDGGTVTWRSEFPITLDRPIKKEEVKRYERKIEGITNVAARAAIERYQPYNKGLRSRGTTLAVLKDFSNTDKHRTLVLQVVWPQGRTDFEIKTPDGDTIDGTRTDDAAELPIHMLINGKPVEVVKMEHSITARIAFPKWGDAFVPLEASEGLTRLHNTAVVVLRDLISFL